jgi:hypothetical protein
MYSIEEDVGGRAKPGHGEEENEASRLSYVSQ